MNGPRSSKVSVDVLSLRYNSAYRHVEVGVAPRASEPYINQLALPGVVLWEGERLADAAERAVMMLLGVPDAPTAIVSGQNLITVGAVHALRKLGRHRDVALVGFDDVELADLLEPGLTVVAQRPQEMGRSAAERLFAALDSGQRLAHARTVIPVDLIARGSGEIRPPRGTGAA